MDIARILSQLTLPEKAALVAGTDFMYTNPIPRLQIPALSMADGPHGLRKQTTNNSMDNAKSEPATAFPTAVSIASSWSADNARRMGQALGAECRHYSVDILLGPGVNLKRNPLCGRNFEYFSEDPLLAGCLGSAMVQGVQGQGVGVSVKHFALNNSENYRFMGDSIADERAMRELYLRAFEQIVKQAKPTALMCAYNKINGVDCSCNPWLLTQVLRDEWGFDGLVMTDWGAMRDRVAALQAGLDLEMPGDTAICRKWIVDGIESGALTMACLDTACEHVLRLIERCRREKDTASVDWDAHHELAGQLAADSAVLLKNDGVLPLAKERKLLVAGELFEKMRYQGSGSSLVNATRVTSPKAAFDEADVDYIYCPGYRENQLEPDQTLIGAALEQTDGCDVVVVFAGLTDYVESEGCDRADLKLPANQLALLDALLDAGKPVVTVLFGGGVTELDFADRVNGLLHLFLPGQNGGSAAYRLLFGKANPGGRLSETWPMRYADVPYGGEFGKTSQEIYRESIFMGYRYYQTAGVPVRYPFGYGLSYTSFSYYNMAVRQSAGKTVVSCEIENTGDRAGSEVVQLYVSGPRSDILKPVRELRAFTKVYLQPGQRTKVTLEVPDADLRYYHPRLRRWVLEPGRYLFQLCRDAQTVICSEPVELEGERVQSPYTAADLAAYRDPAAVGIDAFCAMGGCRVPPLPETLPIGLESRFTDLNQTRLGRLIFRGVMLLPKHQEKAADQLPAGPERDNQKKSARFLRRMLESGSLRSMSMSEGNMLPYNLAQGLMNLANGKIVRGLWRMLRPVRAPKLPKEM